MSNYDVIVIGGGIAGASVAYELSQNQRVLLLEREKQPGYHATGRSAAVYIPTYGHQIAPLFQLTKASRSFMESPPQDFFEESLFKPREMLMVGQSGQTERAKKIQRAMASVNPGIELVDSNFVREKVPVLTTEYADCGIFDPAVFDIDTHGLHDGYLRGLKRRSGDILCESKVEQLSRTNGQWVVTTFRAELFDAPVVINAAGAWADEIACLAGVQGIDLQPLRRTAILVDPPEGSDIENWPLIADFSGRFYFKPDAGLLLASPSDETLSPPCDAQPEELDIAYAAQFLEEVLGLQVKNVRHSWAGLRSFVADHAPVIGYAPDSEGFFWLAGQGGHGFQTAPAMARVAASLVRDEPLPADLIELGFDEAGVSPDRLL